VSLVTIEWPKPDVTKLPTDEHPPASPEDWSGDRPPLGDDDDDEHPKVNLGPGHRTPSVSSTSYDEQRQGLSPSFTDDDGHSFNSAWTTSTNAKKNNVSRGTAAGRQPPDARSVAASVRSAAPSSAWSDAPMGAQSSVPGQRKAGWDTSSAASSRRTTPSTRNEQAARGDEVASISSAQIQRSGKSRSPSVHTTTSSVISGRPTGNYAASVSQSQSSSATGKRQPERDSRSSTTLQNTPPSTRGKRSNGSDQSSKAQSIAEWCQTTSVARSSTGARTPISSRSPTPTEGRSVARSSTSARTAVSSRSSAPSEGGFPTFDNTEWGDPITASQDRPRESSRRSNSKKKEGETENDVSMTVETENKASESAQNAGSGKKYRGWTKKRGGKARPTAKKADTPPEDSVSVMMGVKLPPGGPGSSWGDAKVEW